MGILDNVASAVKSGSTNGAAKADRKPAEFWINIGIELPNPKAGQEGEADMLFIKLPFNLPLDDMNKLEIRGTNQTWLQEAQTRNLLLDMVKAEASKLAQGQGEVNTDLKVQLFRRSADAEISEGDNPLLQALANAFQK
ncbi:single-strand DNA-binding protein [Erwinia phage Pastis]|nr:single-strand DNA-binding protein [Erwinia phage Pastis]